MLFRSNNPRTHPETQIEQLAGLIQKYGFHDSHAIAVDEGGVIIWGHGRLQAARQAGLETVPVEVIEGLSDRDKKSLRIADNGIAEQSGWDMNMLLRELTTLEEMGVGSDVLSLDESVLEELGDALLNDVDDFEGDTDPDEVPDESAVESQVRRGQVWQIGRHRLMCGDSGVISEVEKLMDGKQDRKSVV